MKCTFSFHPEAREELIQQIHWYLQKSERTAGNFRASIDQAVEQILHNPETWKKEALYPTCRRCLVKKFPYKIIYRYAPEINHVTILAVVATKRGDQAWLGRE